jgi:hypothetical protein
MLSLPGIEAVDRARVILPRQRRVVTSLRRPGVWAAVVVIVAGGLLSGCSPDPVPEPTAGASESAATPSPTPTGPVRPERPEAMEDPGTAGAVATATYFMALYGYVGGGDLTEWKALSHPECIFCKGVTDEVERMMSIGHHQDGPTITITATDAAEVKPGEFYGVDFEMTQETYAEFDSQGGVVAQVDVPIDYVIHLIVVRESGQWLVREGEPVRREE